MKVPRYLGVSDIAGMGWCDQQFIFRVRENESMFKSEVKMLRKQPDNMIKFEPREPEIVLVVPARKFEEVFEKIGEELTYEDIKTKAPMTMDTPLAKWSGSVIGIPDFVFDEEFGEFVEPVKMTSAEALALLKPELMRAGIKDEALYAEIYPTIKTFWKWKDYYIVGVPDGLTDEFCYEFKSAAVDFLFIYTKPVAVTQAILYSYFFKKPKIRVQIRIRKTGEIKTVERETTEEEGVKILERMDGLLKGKRKPQPPKQWKCKNCDFKKECNISGL